MSFGSGFGGFGSNSQSGGFSGFGSNNQSSNTGGFGTTGTGFGSNTNTGGGLFGGTSGTFGSGGFSSSSASPFNQNKTGFGSTTTTSGGSLFGGTTSTSGGFGGFGGSSTGFGGGSGTSGSLFGQSKPAFGGGSGTGVFGSGTSTGFGSASTSTPAFGGGSTSSFGANPQNNGTGSIPFQPVEEKDVQGGKNQYWAITCMDPYKAFSFEELRLVDYAQGRKHGNASGQAGAFGSTTGFGNFGSGTGTTQFGSSNTGSGLFGGQSTSSPFAQQSTASGFGGASGTSLFGGVKPASSNLFGGTTTTSGQTGSSLFGTSGTAFGGSGGGFGSGSGGNNLFGQQNQPQNKPTFGFGSGTTGGFGSSTGGGFGNTAASSSGLFGSTTTTASPFGQSGGTAFGSFGQQNQQPQGQTGSSVFGNFGANTQAQQPKPSLFGGTGTGAASNLFGGQQNQPQTTGSNLFGGSGTQQPSSLFGSKPATGSIFGGTGTAGSNLFGNTQQPQQPSGGIFSQSNQQQPSSLFGKPSTGLSSNLFGQSTAQQPTTSSLFGGNQQPQQQPTLGSVFGGSTAQPQLQVQQPLNASTIAFPYGSPSLFMDVPSPNQNPGPIATPLSTSQKSRKQAIIPAYRINPNASSRLITPQKRPQGYGFSYSTYGTPGSAYGSSPIGLGSSLLGSSIGRSLGKSYSSSNLRNSYTAQDSLLVPGAFPGNSRSGTGSMKKLNVNRNINTRRSLFDGDINDNAPNQGSLRKQVSFDSGTKQINGSSMKENGLNGVNGALVRRESPERESMPTPSARSDGRPEMEQVNNGKGKELAVISEDGPPPMATKTSLSDAEKARLTQKDQKPGDYWMNPSMEKIEKMAREERAHIKNLTIGRVGCGQIVFSEVDLNNFPLNKILDNIVKIDIRRATVYGDDTPITKPSPGNGLNVPSTITLENSWPRASAGRLPVFEKHGERFNKHLRRLQRVEGTEFVSYDDKSGRWTFKVEHYTTYGLDYDEDDSVLSSSILSEIAPPTPTPLKVTPRPMSNDASQTSPESSMLSPPESSPDDTFEFKKGKRKNLPGQFDEQEMDILEDDTMVDDEDGMATPQSFLEERSAGSPAGEADHAIAIAATIAEEFEPELEKEMVGSFPKLAATAEHDDTAFAQSPSKLKSILKTNDATGTPYKTARIDVDDWTEQLQRTVSPKKLDRQALKDMQATILMEHDEPKFVPTSTTGGMGFATSIDLMNSLFGSTNRGKRPGEIVNGMELRSGKRLRSEEQLERADHEFHQSFKPNWSANGTLVFATSGSTTALDDGVLVNFKSPLVAEHQDVHFARFTTPEDNIPETIPLQFETCDLIFHNGQIPTTITIDAFDFSNYAEAITPNTPARIHEQHVWNLCSILFDEPRSEAQTGIPEGNLRKQKLIDFWSTLTRKDAETQLQRAQTPEEKAFIYLTCGGVVDACSALIESNNIHLATIVAQLPGDSVFRQTMAKQLDAWREINVLSEIKDPIRAIYEILAGHVSGSEGKMTGTAPENRITPLRFTERFGLTWRQAFGLRLLHGIDEAEDIVAAVSQYAEDLTERRESVRPISWFVEQGVDTDWADPQLQEREDVLWGLLKLYAQTGFEEGMGNVRLAHVLAPENVSGNPIDARLSFQLLHLLRAKRVGNTDEAENTTAADSLSRTYAAALEQIASKDLDALKATIWVLTHLSNPEEREKMIKRILNLHSTMLNPTDHPLTISIPNEASPRVLVPREWECAAKALHARAVEHDHVAEARWLINAGELKEAHDVMCRIIGPQAVVEGSFDQLREVLGSLVDDGNRKTQVSKQAWERGGGLYHVYIELLDLESMHDAHRAKSKLNVKNLVRGLAKTLEGIGKEDGLKGREIRERITLQIMAAKVAKITEREKAVEIAACLKLPLTEDNYLAHSRHVALDYYKALMASAR